MYASEVSLGVPGPPGTMHRVPGSDCVASLRETTPDADTGAESAVLLKLRAAEQVRLCRRPHQVKLNLEQLVTGLCVKFIGGYQIPIGLK